MGSLRESGEAIADSPLSIGDRIRGVHTGEFGVVVMIVGYVVKVRWDDGSESNEWSYHLAASDEPAHAVRTEGDAMLDFFKGKP